MKIEWNIRKEYCRVSRRWRKRRKKKKKALQGIKKNINRDKDFKHVTQNAGKGKRIGSRSIQDVDRHIYRNKENIE